MLAYVTCVFDSFVYQMVSGQKPEKKKKPVGYNKI